jgi:hypothetical protein
MWYYYCLQKGGSLKELNISHNGASETGAIDIGRAIGKFSKGKST